MADEPESTRQPAQVPQITVEPGEDPRATYVNICSVNVTSEEVFLHFGQRTTDNPERAAHVTRLCMSLPHAKRLAVALTNNVNAYEAVFGVVPIDMEERLTPEGRERLAQALAEGEEHDGS